MDKIYNYIFLDFDGTIADSHGFWLNAWKATFAAYRLYPSDEVIINECFGNDLGIEKQGVKDVKKFLNELKGQFEKSDKTYDLYPGAKKALEELKQRGKKLGIVSTSHKSTIERVNEETGLSGLFDVIISGDDVQNFKPHPEPMLKAMKAIDAKSEESIMIGDSPKDIEVAINTNMDSVLFREEEDSPLFAKFPEDIKPTYKINSFDQLLDIMK